jgi:aldose 1-epimerase
MSIDRSDFGYLPDGRPVGLFALSNRTGMTVKITDYGGIVTELHMPDRHGATGDVVLGFDNLGQYLQPSNPYFGAVIGRVANRIAHGSFTIDGKVYQVTVNTPPNTLHGGKVGFDKKLWNASPEPGSAPHDGDALELSLVSPDGDEGFPGRLQVSVVYTLSAARNELQIDYSATTDKPTPVNLTNHSYFNLCGAGNGTVRDHVLTLSADAFTPVGDGMIPTGEIASVAGTPMDFRRPTPIGQRINKVPGASPGGYDHNYVLLPRAEPLKNAMARVFEPTSGRVLEVFTTEPGCQLYTGNFLDGAITGIGGRYAKHGALCLETQQFPDAVNHPNFPSVILRPGQTYRQTTIWRFSTE